MSSLSFLLAAYALLSAVFASLTSILGKVGISGLESNLGTAIRTGVVLIMAWFMVFATQKQHGLKHISRYELGFICLSGLATGASWLCYYKAIQIGEVSKVVPIDKFSIVITIVLAALILKETLTLKVLMGVLFITIGTFIMIL